MLSRRLLRIKVLKALFAHLQSGSDNRTASEKTLMSAIDKAYDLYFQILILPVEVARYARERQEIAKQKKLPTREDLAPNTKFVDNTVIALIAESEAVEQHVKEHKLTWAKNPELIRILYNRLTDSEYYQKYMADPARTFEGDRKLLEDFFVDLQECEALDTALEEMSLMWEGDLPFILIMILRTLQTIRPAHTELRVAEEFKSDDDPAFVHTLFRETLTHYDDIQTHIEKFTAHWDLERIVFMDNLILATAVTELTTFPDIPVKVTLDEYIEISKYYSTPGSSSFINGVLDKIVVALTDEGKIKKFGRGLI